MKKFIFISNLTLTSNTLLKRKELNKYLLGTFKKPILDYNYKIKKSKEYYTYSIYLELETDFLFLDIK